MVKKTDADQADWVRSRKRRRNSCDEGVWTWRELTSLPAIGVGGGDRMHATVALRTNKIYMTKEEVKNVSDSLRRAKTATEAAASMCGKASRAFAEEASTIGECKDVVDSYLLG